MLLPPPIDALTLVVNTLPFAGAYRERSCFWEALVLLRKFFLKLVVIFVRIPDLQGVCLGCFLLDESRGRGRVERAVHPLTMVSPCFLLCSCVRFHHFDSLFRVAAKLQTVRPEQLLNRTSCDDCWFIHTHTYTLPPPAGVFCVLCRRDTLCAFGFRYEVERLNQLDTYSLIVAMVCHAALQCTTRV